MTSTKKNRITSLEAIFLFILFALLYLLFIFFTKLFGVLSLSYFVRLVEEPSIRDAKIEIFFSQIRSTVSTTEQFKAFNLISGVPLTLSIILQTRIKQLFKRFWLILGSFGYYLCAKLLYFYQYQSDLLLNTEFKEEPSISAFILLFTLEAVLVVLCLCIVGSMFLAVLRRSGSQLK